MKNKFTLLHLVLGVMLFFVGCEPRAKDEAVEPAMNHRAEFNQEAFAKVIPYKFKVDWANPVKGYSQELQAEFYEYNIEWLDNFNPDVLEQNRKQLNIHTTYKIIAVPGENKVDFYNVRLIEKNTHKTPGLLLAALGKYSGRAYYFNEQKEKVIIGNYLEGQFKGTLSQRTEEEQKRFLQSARMEPDCYTVTTYHYTDWWQVYPDGTRTLMYSQLTDITYETYCDGGGGYGGGGGTSGGGPDGTYDDCGDPVHGCFYEVEDAIAPAEEIWEAQIDTTDLGSSPCAANVYMKLNQVNVMYNMLENFEGEKPVLHLDWDIEDLGTATGLTRYTIGDPYVEIVLDRTYLNSGSSISVARTMLHEVIHAEMMRKMASVGWNPSNNDFPGLFDYYTRYKYGTDGTPQHNLMASHYRELIITGLKEFDRVNGNADRGDPFYEALSWAGLQNTRAWVSLTDAQKSSYLKVIQDQAKAGGCN